MRQVAIEKKAFELMLKRGISYCDECNAYHIKKSISNRLFKRFLPNFEYDPPG